MKKTYSAVLNYRKGMKEKMRMGTISNFNKLGIFIEYQNIAGSQFNGIHFYVYCGKPIQWYSFLCIIRWYL